LYTSGSGFTVKFKIGFCSKHSLNFILDQHLEKRNALIGLKRESQGAFHRLIPLFFASSKAFPKTVTTALTTNCDSFLETSINPSTAPPNHVSN
jgi:hypothetical protein